MFSTLICPLLKILPIEFRRISPLQLHKVFVSSANRPWLVRGIDTHTHTKGDYVVKPMGAERMSSSAAMRELLAAFIAMEFDLFVVTPAAVQVTSEFVALTKLTEAYQVAQRSLGLNFASRYVDYLHNFAIGQKPPNTLHTQALEILTYDAFISNADRSNDPPKKPNLLTNGKELYLLDHEIAFGFAFDFPSARNQEPWVIRETERLWLERHCLFRPLKGTRLDVPNLIDKFARIDAHFWSRRGR